MIRFVSLCAVLLAGAVPALAQAPDAAGQAGAKVKDPNRKICEEFKDTGSRLGGRRVCMTAADWAAQRRDNRDDVEKAQKSIYQSSGQ